MEIRVWLMEVTQQNLTLESLVTNIKNEVQENPGIIEKQTFTKLPKPSYTYSPEGKVETRGYEFGIEMSRYLVRGDKFLIRLEKSITLKRFGELPGILYELSAHELEKIAPCGERDYKEEPIMSLIGFYKHGTEKPQDTTIKDLYEFIERQFNSYFSEVKPNFEKT